MFAYAQEFCNWMFSGATQSVIDFMSVVLTTGIFVFSLLPIVLIVKFIFKGR